MKHSLKFYALKRFWVTNFKLPDLSFGIHICMDKRVDIHFLTYMISFGNVPIYNDNGTLIAVSNSYHTGKSKKLRAGVP